MDMIYMNGGTMSNENDHDHDHHTHDIRWYDGAYWLFIDGSPYRTATADEVFMVVPEFQYGTPI